MQIMQAVWFAIYAMPLAFAITCPAWLLGKLLGRFTLRGRITLNPLIATSLRRWSWFMLASVTGFMVFITHAITGNLAFLVATLPALIAANYFAFMIAAAPHGARTEPATPTPDRAAPTQTLDDTDLALMTLIAEDDAR